MGHWRDQHQASNSVGMVESEPSAECPGPGMGGDHDPANAKSIKRIDHGTGLMGKRGGTATSPSFAIPMTWTVDENGPAETGKQTSECWLPDAQRPAGAMKEQNGQVAFPLVQ